MTNAFAPVNSLTQLSRRILIWGTFTVLFSIYILNAGWVFTVLALVVTIAVEVFKYFRAKKARLTPISSNRV